jgi:hypothetical protein
LLPLLIFITIIIIIIILGLGSTSGQEHVIFGLLDLIYLIQHDDLQFHPLFCKWHNFISLYGWEVHTQTHIYIYTTFSLFIHWLLGTLAISIAWVLWREIQETWVCRHLSFILIYTSLDICPRVLWQGHR